MVRYGLKICTILVLLISCKKTEDKNQEEESKVKTEKIINSELSAKDIANLKITEYALDPQTAQQIEDWHAFDKLQEVIENVKQADLNFFYNDDESVESLINNLKNQMPKSIRSEATQARVLAVETQLLKLKSLSNLSTTKKPELLASIEGLLKSFSNFNFQMNAKVEADNIIVNKP